MRSVFTQPGPTFPFGTHVAVVEVDTETGKVFFRRIVTVDDAGTVMNPLLAEGQRHGGIAQGAAQAFLEEVVYDEDGKPLTATFADYPFLSATEVPSFELVDMETPTSYNPLGAKGIGEAGSIGATPAVQNAVIDAVSHLGVRHIDMPTSSQRVWRAINAAESPPTVRRRPDPGMEIKLTVNGVTRSDEVKPRLLLIHYLRETLDLRAAEHRCDTTSCGACTVLLDGESVKSCTVLAVQANGRSVTTAEGLVAADGTMSVVQQAFRENHGLQCGFCTPGMAMASTSLLAENPHPTEQEVREGLEGNFAAAPATTTSSSVLAAAEKLSGADGLRPPPLPRRPHDPRAVRLRGGRVPAHAISLLAEHGEDAKLLAGGHSRCR